MSDDGGHAYPHVWRPMGDRMSETITRGGMTLRDAVAKAALPALMASADENLRGGVDADNPPALADVDRAVVRRAFDIADAFVAEKRKRDGA